MFNESLDRFAKSKLKSLSTRGLYRSVVETYRADAVHIQRDGRDLISFCCNDYLGLTHHPEVKAAAAEAIALYGVGAGASRGGTLCLIVSLGIVSSSLFLRLQTFAGIGGASSPSSSSLGLGIV